MINSKVKAYTLLNDWARYKNLHHSHKTLFEDAIDIELEKDRLLTCVASLQCALINDRYPEATERDLEIAVSQLDRHLTLFKDQIMFELLKHGVDNKL